MQFPNVDLDTERVTVVNDVPVVRLTITMEQAEALRTVLRLVGGNDQDSPRRYTQPISNALEAHGVQPAWQDYLACGCHILFNSVPSRATFSDEQTF